jgi:hypothetical protein
MWLRIVIVDSENESLEKFLVGMSEGKMTRGEPRHKRKNITRTSFKETVWGA